MVAVAVAVGVLSGPDTEEAEPGAAAGAGRAQGEVRSCSTARIESLNAVTL